MWVALDDVPVTVFGTLENFARRFNRTPKKDGHALNHSPNSLVHLGLKPTSRSSHDQRRGPGCPIDGQVGWDVSSSGRSFAMSNRTTFFPRATITTFIFSPRLALLRADLSLRRPALLRYHWRTQETPDPFSITQPRRTTSSRWVAAVALLPLMLMGIPARIIELVKPLGPSPQSCPFHGLVFVRILVFDA